MANIELHKAEIGERYGDDSGWEKRVFIDLQKGELVIEVEGDTISCHPRDIDWLITRLQKVRASVGLYPLDP